MSMRTLHMYNQPLVKKRVIYIRSTCDVTLHNHVLPCHVGRDNMGTTTRH